MLPSLALDDLVSSDPPEPFALPAPNAIPRLHLVPCVASHPPSLLPPALLSRPPFAFSSSYKENAPASSSSSSSSTLTSPIKRKRRVYFSPTPLPSLEASPKHKRAFAVLGVHDGNWRPAKRLRNVYSNHPFFGAGSVEDGEDSSPSSGGSRSSGFGDEVSVGSASSPPTSPATVTALAQPARLAPAKRPSFAPFMPFTLPGLEPAPLPSNPQPPAVNDGDDGGDTDTATDSETESDFVSSLLLRTSSASSTVSSSSPIRSPCSPFLDSCVRPTPFLKGILKRHHIPVGAKAANEKEGTRRNGRGRRHVLGWEDMRMNEAAGGSGEEKGGDGAADKGKGKERATRRSAGETKRAKEGKADHGAAGDDGDDERRQRADSSAAPAGSRQPCRIVCDVQDDDPVLLRTPLLTLKGSLRPVSASYVRPVKARDEGVAPPLQPRSSPAASDAPAEDDDEAFVDGFNALFETPTFLTDVEEAYVHLSRALFRLPVPLASPSTTLDPLRLFRSTLLRCLARDIENIITFPEWVKSQSHSASSSPGSSSRSSSSSPGSSPIVAGSSPRLTVAASGKGKKSLTEEQMRRMRDEMGAAQAAIKCTAALLKDERVVALFPGYETARELTSLLRLIVSLPLSPNLSVLVHRELVPFVPFLVSQQHVPTAILAPLISSHILPSLRATLSAPPRIDRYRLSFGESLSALSSLLEAHPREMLQGETWKVWFRPAMLGLWDGAKKGTSVKGKAVRVVGRLVRALTVAVPESGVVWIREREEIAKDLGAEMLAILHETPSDAPVVRPKDGKSKETAVPSRLLLLSTQMVDATKNLKSNPMALDECEFGALSRPPTSKVLKTLCISYFAAALLYTVSLLSVLPALLGPSFRQLEEKGIGPWIRPFNELKHASSSHILVLSAIMWSHLAYSFLRTTSVKSKGLWVFRKPDRKPFEVLLRIFEGRGEVWRKNVAAAGTTPAKKDKQRMHAKALALAFVATVYGLTVVVHHGISSVRDPSASASLSSDQLEHLDTTFTELLHRFLPILVHSTVSEASSLGWSLLSSVVRPKTPSDPTATLEALINPVFLDGAIPQLKTAEQLELTAASAIAKAVGPGRVPSWGREWVTSRVEKVLDLLGECLGGEKELAVEIVEVSLFRPSQLASAPSTNILTFFSWQASVIPVWQNLLRSLADDEPALSKAFTWLVDLPSSRPVSAPLAQRLWTATLARAEPSIVAAVQRTMQDARGGLATVETVAVAWAKLREKSEAATVALGTSLSPISRFQPNASQQVQMNHLDAIASLLRYHAEYAQFVGSLLTHAAYVMPPPPTAHRRHPRGNPSWRSLAHSTPCSGRTRTARLNSELSSPFSSDLPATLSRALSPSCSPQLASSAHLDSLTNRDLRLCILLVSASDDLSAEARETILLLSTDAVTRSLGGDVVDAESILLIARLLEVASDSAFTALYELVLEKLKSSINPSTASLQTFLPVITPSLNRAFDLQATTERADSFSQSRSIDPSSPSLRPLFAFFDFWNATFGPTTEDIEYPKELVEVLSIMRDAAAGLVARNLGDTQLASQLEESMRMLPPAGQAHSRRAKSPTPPPTAPAADVSGRGYEADQSRFCPPTGYASSSHESSLTVLPLQGPRGPSPSLYGSAYRPDSLGGSVIEETPKELEMRRSRASYASLASVAETEGESSESTSKSSKGKGKGKGKGKNKGKGKGKRKRAEEEMERATPVADGSSDDEIVGVSSKSTVGSRKKAKSAKRCRSAPSATIEIVSGSIKATEAKKRAAQSTEEEVTTKRVRKSKGKGKAAEGALHFVISSVQRVRRLICRSPSAAPEPPLPERNSSPVLSSSDGVRTPILRLEDPHDGEDEVLRSLLAMPVDTVVQVSKRIGGSPALQRLIELGERAKVCFPAFVAPVETRC
ncbi:SPOSA6832_01041, partial [Sporobolomyces salmonicolor]